MRLLLEEEEERSSISCSSCVLVVSLGHKTPLIQAPGILLLWRLTEVV